MKRRINISWLLLVLALLLSGCGRKNEPIQLDDTVAQSAPVPAGAVPAAGERESEGNPRLEREEGELTPNSARDDLDMDLTAMGPDMIYATVVNIILDPETYAGQTIRISGSYIPIYREKEDKHYHYCLIADAMACCARGMQFVWEDGSHQYPEEYPPEGGFIIVEGTLEVFDAGQYKGIRIVDATMEML